MALDTLDVFGIRFTNVKGFVATDINSTDRSYLRPQGSKSITQNGNNIDVTEYATANVNVQSGAPNLQDKTVTPTTSQQTVTADSGYDGLDTVTVNAMPTGTVTAPASISATSATVSASTSTLTLSKTVSVTPNVTTAGYVSSGTAGNSSVSLSATVNTINATTHHPQATDLTLVSGSYLRGNYTIKGVTTTNLTAENIKNGVVVQVGDNTDSDCVTSVTGTYSGGGTSSKNTQVYQQTGTRITATSYTKACGDLTVSKTGTYDVYWTSYRTSSSGTWGTQLYIDSSAYGSAQTSFTSSYYQAIHLTNVSLTANQKLAVYGRSRGSNYYLYVGQLTIIEA